MTNVKSGLLHLWIVSSLIWALYVAYSVSGSVLKPSLPEHYYMLNNYTETVDNLTDEPERAKHLSGLPTFETFDYGNDTYILFPKSSSPEQMKVILTFEDSIDLERTDDIFNARLVIIRDALIKIVSLPLLALIGFLVANWIWRGFRPAAA